MKRSKNLSTDAANDIYDVQAHFYDHVAHGLLHRRQKLAIERMNIQPGSRVLEVGIGTGLSIPLYPPHCTVFGIDLSGGMLHKARQKVEREKFDHIRLVRCNALEPPFADGIFDYIFLSHVISVVQDPPELIRVVKRLGKPGCRIVIINHFKSPNRLVGMIEHWLNPLCKKLGWRSDLTLRELVERGGLQIDFQYKLAVFDLWRTVFATNAEPTARITTIPIEPPRLPAAAGNGTQSTINV